MGKQRKIESKEIIKTSKKMMFQTGNQLLDEMESMFNQPHYRLIKRRRSCQMRNTWRDQIKLCILPTEVDNLAVKIKQNKMRISGKSETENETNGFKTKSTHQWSRELTIPDTIDTESIKVKLNENKNMLTIESSEKQPKTTLTPIMAS